MTLSPKKILIIGSGAKHTVEGSWDEIVCANSALYRVPSKVNCPIIHVASINLFGDAEACRYLTEKGKSIIKTRQLSIENRAPDCTYICEQPRESLNDYITIMKQKNYSPINIIPLNIRERNKMIMRFLGSEIWFKSWLSKNQKAKNLGSLYRHLVFGDSIHHAFKPSTGIFSLLIALERNGIHHQYYLDGIGLDRSNSFYHGKSFASKSGCGHMPFDALAIKKAKKLYSIHLMNLDG